MNLESVPFRSDDGRMQALIHALLGSRNVIVELSRDRVPHGMDYPERTVTIALLVDAHPDADEVVDLIERAPLEVHLSVNRIDVFGPAGERRFDPRFVQGIEQNLLYTLDIFTLRRTARLDPFADRLVFMR